jgi:hypothetical protein
MTTTAAPQLRCIVSTQVTSSVRAELERRAAEADRSLSAQVRRAIHEHLERTTDEKEEGSHGA